MAASEPCARPKPAFVYMVRCTGGTLYTGWRPWREQDVQASEAMMTYWANFVKFGDPNGDGMPVWEKHAMGDERCMLLNAQPHMGDVPRKEQAAFLQKTF